MATKQTKTETPPDEERIQQLMEQFPEIPRSTVVKADVLGAGAKPSPGSRLAGRRSLPDAHWYFEYDMRPH